LITRESHRSSRGPRPRQSFTVSLAQAEGNLTSRKLFSSVQFYARQLYRQVLLRVRISYGNSVRPSVRLSVCHDPVPNQAQVR